MKSDDRARTRTGDAALQPSPAQAAIKEFLRVQSGVAPRSTIAKVFGRSPLGVEGRHWFWGVMGELEIAGSLEQLGRQWTVLHSIHLGEVDTESERTEIDHMVIGPAGVFTVSTKNHSGQSVWAFGRTFTAAGHRLPHIRAAEVKVGQAEKFLGAAVGDEVPITAIIAVVDPDSLTVREVPRDVVVVAAGQLLRWLRGQPHTLTADKIEALSHAALNPATWPHREQPTDAQQQRAEFEQVRRAVFSARLLRQLWLVAGAVLLTTAMVVVGYLELSTEPLV